MSEVSDLVKISKHENLLFEILFPGSLAILYGLLIYFLYVDMPGFVLLETLASPFVLVAIFSLVLKEKTVFKKTRKNPKIFFDVLGNEKMIFRYHNVVHYRRSSFRIFVLMLFVFGGFLLGVEYDILTSDFDKNDSKMVLIGAMLLPGSITYGFHILKNSFSYNDVFDYYFSKACFQVLSNDKKIVEVFQLRLVVDGLKAYNGYLNSKIGRHIEKLDNVILTILGDTKDTMNKTIENINHKLDSPDSLELLRFLTIQTGKNNLIFADTKGIEKMKEVIPIILPPIALAITVVQYVSR